MTQEQQDFENDSKVISNEIRSAASDILNIMKNTVEQLSSKLTRPIDEKEKWLVMARIANFIWIQFYQGVWDVAATSVLRESK